MDVRVWIGILLVISLGSLISAILASQYRWLSVLITLAGHVELVFMTWRYKAEQDRVRRPNL